MGYFPKNSWDALRIAEIVSDDPADGVDVSAVAARARRLKDPKLYSLVWFLAALLNRPGGRKRVAEQLSRAFPKDFVTDAARWLALLCVDPADGLRDLNRIEALYQYQQKQREEALGSLVKTTVASRVMDRLDFVWGCRRMVLIQGEPGIGKSTAARAWCEANLGCARYVSLPGTLNRTTFFQAIARALGLSAASTTPPGVLQTRIEDLLLACPLLIVFDESQHLFDKPARNRTAPDLLEWINTALYNERVPVALVASPQFSTGLAAVEELSQWNCEQFKSRVRITDLEQPTKDEVETVAGHMFSDWTIQMRQVAVSFALSTRHPMRALADAGDEAIHLARARERDRVTSRDLAEAIRRECLPSEKAKGLMVKAGQVNLPRQPRRGFAAPLRPAGSQAAEDTFGGVAPVNRSRLSGTELAVPTPVALG